MGDRIASAIPARAFAATVSDAARRGEGRCGAGRRQPLQPDGFPEVRFQFDEEYAGEIFTEFDGKEVGIGTASPAKKSDA